MRRKSVQEYEKRPLVASCISCIIIVVLLWSMIAFSDAYAADMSGLTISANNQTYDVVSATGKAGYNPYLVAVPEGTAELTISGLTGCIVGRIVNESDIPEWLTLERVAYLATADPESNGYDNWDDYMMEWASEVLPVDEFLRDYWGLNDPLNICYGTERLPYTTNGFANGIYTVSLTNQNHLNYTQFDSMLVDQLFDTQADYYKITLQEFSESALNCNDIAIDLAVIIVKVGGTTSAADKENLQAAITLAENLSQEDVYTSGDRWNGKVSSTNGFWSDMTDMLAAAKTVQRNATADQDAVDNAYRDLNDAIANLIPADRANATALHEALGKHWVWDESANKVLQYWGNNNYKDISAANTTAVTWGPYAAALAEGAELIDELYDDGEPTNANTDAANAQIAAIVANLDVNKLVNQTNYTKAYNSFQTRKSAAESLLAQADPTKLTGTYSDDSVAALRSAWTDLNNDLNHRLAGGTKADMTMLKGFSAHYSALQAAWQGLVSDEDITVDFTYVNNFAAKYPALRQSGQDVFLGTGVQLSRGHTTVQELFSGSFIQTDSKDFGVSIPGEQNNLSDTDPLYLVYVNDRYMGSSRDSIQLHQGDRVRLVRICEPAYVIEASSGLSSSNNFLQNTVDPAYIGDSLAVIDMTAPVSVQVGSKAQFTATLTGAYGSNIGAALSPANITLFVSAPYADESGWYLNQPTVNTGVTTNAAGKLEYVFTEPGWYTVAMFNTTDDVPHSTDIYGDVTKGIYPSVYAGDFAVVHVVPAGDDAEVLAQYKAEYAATANAYFNGFHDYDFAGDYYENTFKKQYEDLTYHLSADVSLTALKAQFETDFAILKASGATAIDHQAVVNALRQNLSYLPDDLATLNSGNAALVTEIQTAYAAMNDHTKTLLTPEEQTRLDAVAAIDAAALPMVAGVTVRIVTEGTLPFHSGSGNPYFGNANLVWATTPNPDGTVDNPVWAKLVDQTSLSAKAGDHVFVRRYLATTDAQYWLVWSADGWTTQTPAVAQTLVTPEESQTSYDGYYLVEYVIPQDTADDSTVTLQLKMQSKEEFDSNGLAATKESALAAVQAAYDSYDLSKYDEDGQAALLAALNKGKRDINAAATNNAVTAARKTAVGAMAAVRKSGASQNNAEYDMGEEIGSVHVLIENTIYSDSAFYKPNYGTIAEGDFVLGSKDSMMTVVLRALHEAGFTWNGTIGDSGATSPAEGYVISYLGSINKDGDSLGEFDGNNKSGWMGTLNDWFVNESFAAFTVANGKLESGDEIHIMFTMELGADIGGTWGNNNTALATLDVTGGTLAPTFAGSTTEYSLIVPAGGANVTVYPVPVNKNYQSRIFLNDYNKDAAQYKRTDLIAVKPGDVLYVGVGEQGWPTMNSGGKPTKYTIKVATADDAVNALDESKVKLSNYKDYAAKLAGIDREKLSDAGKAKYDAVKEKITFYSEIDAVRDLLSKLPKEEGLSDAAILALQNDIEAADAAYKDLTEAQRDYITVGDAAKYNALQKRLEKLKPDTTAQTIVGGSGGEKKEKKTEGSEIAPAQVVVAPEVAADGTAKAEVKAEDVSKALEEAPDAKTLTVKVDTEGAASVEADLPADAVRAAADAGVGLNVETENSTVKLSAADVKAAGGKDLAVSVKSNADGTTSFEVSAGGTAVAANVKVELPAKDGQVLVIVNADGTEEVVKKCVTSDGKVYAEIPAGAKVKVADAQGMTFGDVKETDWFAGAVEFVSSHGIFQGTGEGFEPGTTMNRTMLAMVLYRIDGATGGGKATFADVKPEDWFADAVSWAADAGIVNGRGEGFAPDAPVTREEIATMLYRFVQYLGVDVSGTADLGTFPDGGETSPWAKDAMAWAVSVGLFKGDDNGALNPAGEATRAEVATLVERLVKLLVK